MRVLGDFGDQAIVAEAKRRFAEFVKNPASLPGDLRDPVLHVAGAAADRQIYDALHELGRKTTNTEERVRAYSALASARDAALAKETLAIALTDELNPTMIGTLITNVALQGEHRDLAWEFVRTNFSALASRQGPSFRYLFVSNLLASFSDPEHADELMRFPAMQETSGARIMAERARERILTDVDFIAQQLPAVDAWIASRVR